jgi:opacity protein-like surface antigen
MWLLLAGAAYSATTVFAQSELSRISIAERSDGRGFVMRYHLSEAPDSFRVVRPSVNLVQVNLYGPRLISGEVPVGENDEIAEIQLFDIENGVGADIYLNENVFFNSDAYPDINGTDLLLALEYASEESVLASVTENLEFSREREENGEVSPPLQDTSVDAAEAESVQEEGDEDIQVQPVYAGRDEKKVTIGVVAGISLADVQGSAFASEVRQGTSFGLAVGVRLPWELPFNIGTGLETGVYYAQKGFKNPSPDFLNAETVEFDYIEVPVLAKFSYPLIERVSPYLLVGPSIGFNVNAERVRSDESRSDLDDQTRRTDLSMILGGGLDIKLNRQVFTLQAKGGWSFSDVFETADGSSPTDFFKHRYIALELIFRL